MLVSLLVSVSHYKMIMLMGWLGGEWFHLLMHPLPLQPKDVDGVVCFKYRVCFLLLSNV